jgi:hypothetical protein
MPELQKLQDTILVNQADKRNFQRNILGNDILKRLNEIKKRTGAQNALVV